MDYLIGITADNVVRAKYWFILLLVIDLMATVGDVVLWVKNRKTR